MFTTYVFSGLIYSKVILLYFTECTNSNISSRQGKKLIPPTFHPNPPIEFPDHSGFGADWTFYVRFRVCQRCRTSFLPLLGIVIKGGRKYFRFCTLWAYSALFSILMRETWLFSFQWPVSIPISQLACFLLFPMSQLAFWANWRAESCLAILTDKHLSFQHYRFCPCYWQYCIYFRL